MEDKPQIESDTWEIARTIADFSVGLCIVTTVGGIEDALPLGSGTLAKVRGVSGILTAGHVLAPLQEMVEHKR